MTDIVIVSRGAERYGRRRSDRALVRSKMPTAYVMESGDKAPMDHVEFWPSDADGLVDEDRYMAEQGYIKIATPKNELIEGIYVLESEVVVVPPVRGEANSFARRCVLDPGPHHHGNDPMVTGARTEGKQKKRSKR